MTKYIVDMGAFLTIFSAVEAVVDADSEEEAIELAKEQARDLWLEKYPSLDDTGTITVSDVREAITRCSQD